MAAAYRTKAAVAVAGVACAVMLGTGCTRQTDVPAARPTVPVAADGTDLAACADGSCEVRVDRPVRIPLGRQFMVADLHVVSIGKTAATLKAVATPGGSSFSCAGDRCSVSVKYPTSDQPGMATATVSVGGHFIANGIGVTVVAVAKGFTILRLAPASGGQ